MPTLYRIVHHDGRWYASYDSRGVTFTAWRFHAACMDYRLAQDTVTVLRRLGYRVKIER